MDGERFDSISRSLAAGTTRRQVVRFVTGTVLAGIAGVKVRPVSASGKACDSAIADDCYASAEADTNDDVIDCIEFGPAFFVCMVKVIIKYNNRLDRCNKKAGCPETSGYRCSNGTCCGFDTTYDIQLQGCAGACYNPEECLHCQDGAIVSTCPPPKHCILDPVLGFRGCRCESGTDCGDTCCDTTKCQTCVNGTCQGCDDPLVCTSHLGFMTCDCPSGQSCGDSCCHKGEQCCDGTCKAACDSDCEAGSFPCYLTSTSYGAIACCPDGTECCPGNWLSMYTCGPDPQTGLCCQAGEMECTDRCCAPGLVCQSSGVNGTQVPTCCPDMAHACNGGCCDADQECGSCDGVHEFCHTHGDWSMC